MSTWTFRVITIKTHKGGQGAAKEQRAAACFRALESVLENFSRGCHGMYKEQRATTCLRAPVFRV